MLREYFEINEEKGWIRRSISPTGAFILFVFKKDRGLRLYINYRSLNRIIIKNRIYLLFINKTLDRLYKTIFFTKLDFIYIYYRLRIR